MKAFIGCRTSCWRSRSSKSVELLLLLKAAAAELAAVALDMRRPSTCRATDTVQLLPPELPPPLGFKRPREAEVVEPLLLLISSCHPQAG